MLDKTMSKDLNKLTSAIKLWSAERGIDNSNPKDQMLKVGEEVGELFSAVARGNFDLIIDSAGDVFVTLVILCQQYQIELADCVNAAYNEIKDRKGEKIDGIFVKEEDLDE